MAGTQHKLNHIVPTYMKQIFGKFQVTVDTRPFNRGALRISALPLVLLQSLSPNRLISLTLPAPIHTTSCILQGIVNTFMTSRPKARVQIYEEGQVKLLHQISGFWGIAWCLKLLPAADAISLKHLGSKAPPRSVTFYEAVIEWADTLENESIAWFLNMLT